MLETARKLWYRADKYSEADTEEALAHDDIAEIGSEWFEPVSHSFLGGPAYFLILNSLLFRIPLAAKPKIAPPFLLWKTCITVCLDEPGIHILLRIGDGASASLLWLCVAFDHRRRMVSRLTIRGYESSPAHRGESTTAHQRFDRNHLNARTG